MFKLQNLNFMVFYENWNVGKCLFGWLVLKDWLTDSRVQISFFQSVNLKMYMFLEKRKSSSSPPYHLPRTSLLTVWCISFRHLNATLDVEINLSVLSVQPYILLIKCCSISISWRWFSQSTSKAFFRKWMGILDLSGEFLWTEGGGTKWRHVGYYQSCHVVTLLSVVYFNQS